jgi:hypothetical protein
MLALWLWLSAIQASSQDQAPVSGMGVTRTVAQLMASPQASPTGKSLRPRRIPARSKIFSRPSISSKSALKPGDPIGPLLPQTSGTIFTGDSALATSVTPPDSIGAAGPTQILVCTNNRIRVFSKTGVLGALNMSTDSFFAPALPPGRLMTDPRVRYDRNAQRWFVTAISDDLVNNRIMIAVSSGPTITGAGSFTFFFVQQNLAPPAGDNNLFADYPTLGVDVNALYIGANMFDGGGNYQSTSAWVIQKSSILGAGPLQVTAFRNLSTPAGGMITPQGVDNDDPGATEGYFVGVDSAAFSKLVLRRISSPGSTTPTSSGDLNLTVPATAYPVGLAGPNPGVEALQSNAMDDGDDRLLMAQIRNIGGTSFLWTCHNIGVTSAGVASVAPDRDGARWYKIGTLSSTPTLSDFGTFFDSTGGTGQSYWMPSLNVSGQGHMVLGCNFAKPTVRNGQFVGSMISGHLAGDAAGVTQPATIIDQSTTGYAPTPNNGLGGATAPSASIFERWGDFSYTSVDPADDMTMWTVQEFPLDTTHWGVRVIQIRAPQPPVPLSASPSSVAAGLASVSVTITGTASPGEGWFEPGPSFPNHVSGLLSNTLTGQSIPINSMTVVDATHLTLNLNTVGITPGAFNLTITNPDGQPRLGNGILTIAAGSGAPSCVITGPASPSNANPMNFAVTFPEVMNGLTAGGFTLTNAGSPVLTGAGPAYTLAVTPTAQGAVTVALPAGSATGNVSGLPNTNSNTATVTWDSSAPTATVAASVAITNANPTFTVTFSQAVTGLVPGDFTPSSGSVSSVIGNGNIYVVTVSGAAQGTLTLTLPAGSVQDAAGNGNALASGSTIYDTIGASVTVTPPAASTRVSPIPFTITFSEPVSGLDMTGINVTGGSGTLSGSGTSYTVNVVPAAEGTVVVVVAAGAALDAAGNGNFVSNAASTVYDITPPNTTILSSPNNPSGPNSATFTFTSTEPGSTFLVQIDGSAFTPNTTGTQSYTGLAAGTHTFAVAAVDPAGNVDPSPATFTWSIPFVPADGVAPLLNPFDSSLFLENWTLSAPNAGVGWAADATPGSVLGALPYVSAPGSLNYNNGTNYSTGAVANSGSARSPLIDRTALPGTLRLKFMCNYQTDTTGTATDTRTVTIWKGDLSGTWTAPIQLSGGVTALGACSSMGIWHEHTLDLQPAWTPDLRVEFTFDTVDNLNNTGAGWFIDDFEISDLVVSSIQLVTAGSQTVIPIGSTTTASAVALQGVVTQGITSARLDAEIQPLGTPFTGTATVSGTATGAGAPIVTGAYTIPAVGDYHVRVRTVDLAGPTTSGWMEFGLNATTAPDFTVVPIPPPPSHGGGHGGCGLTGFEGALLLGLLRLRRRT